MQASTHRAAYPHVRINHASYVDAKKAAKHLLSNTEGENFITRFCVTGTHRFQPHFCENSGLLRGINWWRVSHLVEEHFYHHFWGFDNFFEGGTVPLTWRVGLR